MKIQVTNEIAKEIKESINCFKSIIEKEMSFSSDLRKNDKIELYSNKIAELEKSLELGWI